MKRGAHGTYSEVAGKALDRRLLGRLLTYLRPYRVWVTFSVILMLIGSVVQLAGPAIAQIAIDRYITAGDLPLAARLSGLNLMALLFLGTVVGGFLFQYAQMYLMSLTGQRAMYDLRLQLYEHLLELPMSYYDRSSVGWVMTRLTNDIEVLNEMFTSGVVAIFGDIFLLIGIVAFMFYLDARLAAVVMVVVPLLFGATLWFRVRARDSYREVRARLGRLNAFLQENLMGVRVVQIFNRERRNYERFRDINREYKDAYVRTIFYYALFFPGVDYLSALALAMLIYFGGGWAIQGTLTLGVIYAFILYVQRFYRPIRDLAEKYNILQSAMASSERIFRLLDEPVTITAPPQPRFPEHLRGRVTFEHVWFGYEAGATDDEEESTRRSLAAVDWHESSLEVSRPQGATPGEREWVLQDLCFDLTPGKTAAIVGATGAGKTTIISLLTRLYDVQRGRVLLDGMDLREMDPARLRRGVGVVLQDVFLFSGTIEGNIRLEEPTIDRAAVERAARHVNASYFIERLPNGYDSEVQERGATLSTGQRQLLAFARALAFDPAILILDEATSSVDTATEVLIQDALRKLMRGRTTLVIAHRLSTIQQADTILVLHKGQLREQGTHHELLRQQGIYHRLYRLQYQAQR